MSGKPENIRLIGDVFTKSAGHMFQSILSCIGRGTIEYVSFEDALKEMYGTESSVPQMAEEARKVVAEIMKLCNQKLKNINSLGQVKGLTDDQKRALISYTIDENNSTYIKVPPYRKVNRVLGERDINGLRACRYFILYLLSSLRAYGKYVPKKATTLYRAITSNDIKLDTYAPGTMRSWAGFTSTTTENDVLDEFLRDDKTPILFEINGDYIGYEMKPFSMYTDEEEIILEPDTIFTTESITKRDGNITYIKVHVEKSEIPIENEVRVFTKLINPQQQNTLVAQKSAPCNNNVSLSTGTADVRPVASVFQLPQAQFTTQSPTQPQIQFQLPPQPQIQFQLPPQPQVQFTTQPPPQHQIQFQLPQQPQQPALEEGWVIHYDPCTGMPYYYNKALNKCQIEKPIAKPKSELPLCSCPFTCHRKDSPEHLNAYRHACKYEITDCNDFNNPDHKRTHFHLLKPVCTVSNCPLVKDPAHRFEYSHEGKAAFMTMCRERALCNCVDANNDSHLMEEFHTDTNFEYPKQFSYN